MENKVDIAKILIEVGANTDITDEFDMTAFDHAKVYQHIEIIELLQNHKFEKTISKLDDISFSV